MTAMIEIGVVVAVVTLAALFVFRRASLNVRRVAKNGSGPGCAGCADSEQCGGSQPHEGHPTLSSLSRASSNRPGVEPIRD